MCWTADPAGILNPAWGEVSLAPASSQAWAHAQEVRL
jgi:hypothetical protein